MLRIRRYRLFLIFASITIVALYQFTSITSWEKASSISVESLKGFGGLEPEKPVQDNAKPDGEGKPAQPDPNAPIQQKPPQEEQKEEQSDPSKEGQPKQEAPPPPVQVASSTAAPAPVPVSSTKSSPLPAFTPGTPPDRDPSIQLDEINHEQGKGRFEVPTLPTNYPPIHWKKLPEHFPVKPESIIPLPTGQPKTIPKVQFDFQEESPSEKTDREGKLASIKEAFTHAWAGYKEKAWLHDELSPVSGENRDPFCAWGATLVDSLDTLWMMDLRPEFDEAVEALTKIDFTTSKRNDIPLFETTIRYLGGLLGAYDISGAQNRTILDKAVELAEVLMGAFDTPNRMPQMYYNWKPTFASQPHRAGARVVLAEIGSLSVEFTRLAQITKEQKYYDAIARITNAFEAWQKNTILPGMWPISVDTSGCAKEPYSKPKTQQPIAGVVDVADPKEKVPKKEGSAGSELDSFFAGGAPSSGNNRIKGWDENTAPSQTDKKDSHGIAKPVVKRQLDEVREAATDPSIPEGSIVVRSAVTGEGIPGEMHCKPQGLSAPQGSTRGKFTLGGQSDSIYEYLPKEYLLLGGLTDQYRTMYVDAIEVVKKDLLYRPMNPKNQDILFSGTLTAGGGLPSAALRKSLNAEGTHLTCFAGGMLALGAKIFNRPEDLELGAKLTDGCVWAYESTQTGIMPEGFTTLPCEDRSYCPWNETAYYDALDPWMDSRERQREQRDRDIEEAKLPILDSSGFEHSEANEGNTMVKRQSQSAEVDLTASTSDNKQGSSLQGASEVVEKKASDDQSSTAPKDSGSSQGDNKSEEDKKKEEEKKKEEAKKKEEEERKKADEKKKADDKKKEEEKKKADDKKKEEEKKKQDATKATSTVAPAFTPPPPPTHDEYVKSRIKDERLPPGFVNIASTKYILRPEAIESVFVLYRITGDEHWRKVGWSMFTAIQQHTRTDLGNSAIDDVTKEHPEQLDEMESFWLAETLKYFYLLFSDPSHVSLDDYVLNTEAHPLKRPQPTQGQR
ncbi:MAG: hypothetical protein M4579_004121 [Chaenotheca gracillima]|nr:MAG: hypothetical protein M4579_004121 [Chaenotheca gracillima]